MDACTGLKPCENDGECVNILGDYYCNCPNGYAPDLPPKRCRRAD